MSEPDNTAALLAVIEEISGRFHLATLAPQIQTCRRLLARPESVSVAVLGGFKVGKSSFINTLAGAPILPVGILPATAVLTRVTAGPKMRVRIALPAGSLREISPAEIADWVTQERNPNNAKGVTSVSVEAPTMARFGELVFIDTPGLGSVFAHNSETSLALLPRVEAAILATSCVQALSAADLKLFQQLAATTPRLAVLLTKADLCTSEEQTEITSFVRRLLKEAGVGATVHLWSQQTGFEEQRAEFLRDVILPLAAEQAAVSLEIAIHKTDQLARELRSLLSAGAAAARRSREEREHLGARLDALCEGSGGVPAVLARFEHEAKSGCTVRTLSAIDPATTPLREELRKALDQSLAAWGGTLATAGRRYEAWLRDSLARRVMELGREKHDAMLAPLSDFAATSEQLVGLFHRHLAVAVREILGVRLELTDWQARLTPPAQPDISVSPAFDLRLDWLWAITPASWVRPRFRRHLRDRIAWEVEKNLSRLAAQWSKALGVAIGGLAATARKHVEMQCTMLKNLLSAENPDPAPWEAELERLASMSLFER